MANLQLLGSLSFHVCEWGLGDEPPTTTTPLPSVVVAYAVLVGGRRGGKGGWKGWGAGPGGDGGGGWDGRAGRAGGGVKPGLASLGAPLVAAHLLVRVEQPVLRHVFGVGLAASFGRQVIDQVIVYRLLPHFAHGVRVELVRKFGQAHIVVRVERRPNPDRLVRRVIRESAAGGVRVD